MEALPAIQGGQNPWRRPYRSLRRGDIFATVCLVLELRGPCGQTPKHIRKRVGGRRSVGRRKRTEQGWGAHGKGKNLRVGTQGSADRWSCTWRNRQGIHFGSQCVHQIWCWIAAQGSRGIQGENGVQGTRDLQGPSEWARGDSGPQGRGQPETEGLGPEVSLVEVLNIQVYTQASRGASKCFSLEPRRMLFICTYTNT